MPTHTVFYSWQSDRPNSFNRGFIEDCLTKAMKLISSDDELQLDPCLDRDTSGVPGSPDIAATIFAKIQRADVFVGDVTFIDDGNNRRTPNPNVLIELGFAAAHLGWENIICVFNSAFGKIDDLPFDLRTRRVRAYSLQEAGEKANVRNNVVRLLRADIQGILDAPAQADQPPSVPEIDATFEQVELKRANYTVTVIPKNNVPFEYMVSLRRDDGESVANQFQMTWTRVFPTEVDGASSPMKWKLDHHKINTGTIIVVKVEYRELMGPFRSAISKRYKLLQYGPPKLVDDSQDLDPNNE